MDSHVQARPAADTTRVLIVDDQPAFRKAASFVVESVDGMYVVAEAHDQESALSSALASPLPDVAIVDLHLGRDDGTEVCRQLRSARPELVVVLVSTTALEDLPSDVYTCGAQGFIAKSQFGPATLSETMESSRHLR